MDGQNCSSPIGNCRANSLTDTTGIFSTTFPTRRSWQRKQGAKHHTTLSTRRCRWCYVMGLSGGGSMIAPADDEECAWGVVGALKLQHREVIESVRPLSHSAVRLTPTDAGWLEVNSWDDVTIDDILAQGYPQPLLNDALQQTNSLPLIPPGPNKVTLKRLSEAYERNVELIRIALRKEIERLRKCAVDATGKWQATEALESAPLFVSASSIITSMIVPMQSVAD